MSPTRQKKHYADVKGPARQYGVTGTTTYGYKPQVTHHKDDSVLDGVVPGVWKQERPRWNVTGHATMVGENRNTDIDHHLRDHYPHVVDKHHVKYKDYKPTDEVFIPEKLEDLDEVPFYLRDVIQKIIDKKTKLMIDEEMAIFKDKLREDFEIQKNQNQIQIGHHLTDPKQYEHFKNNWNLTHKRMVEEQWAMNGYYGNGHYGGAFPYHNGGYGMVSQVPLFDDDDLTQAPQYSS